MLVADALICATNLSGRHILLNKYNSSYREQPIISIFVNGRILYDYI